MERTEYRDYINSPDWRSTRLRYFRSKLPSDRCQACGASWEPGFHLHHRSYKRLGNERLNDFVMMCADCHRELHRRFREATAKRGWGDLWKFTKRFIHQKCKRR